MLFGSIWIVGGWWVVEWDRKSYLQPAEIASFSDQDFSRSNKHETFWHVVSIGYFYVFFLWTIAVSDFHLLEIRRVNRNFLGQGSVFLELGHFDKQLSTTQKKKGPTGKNLFSTKLLKTTMRHLTHRWPQLGNFSTKLGHFFPISEKGQRKTPPL